MAVLPILIWPDARLSEAAVAVGELDDGVRALAADMLETMYAAPGRGLAGPQVGAMRRIFVMDCGWKEGEPAPMVLIDPVLLAAAPETAAAPEGCLSIPGIAVEVTRPASVTMAWTGLDGFRIERRFDGFEARCAQHELDHLDGIVTLDRVGPEARAAAEAAYARARAVPEPGA